MTVENDNPLYGVTRGPKEGCGLVRWSEMTEAERERAWRDYERAFGASVDRREIAMRFLSDPTVEPDRVEVRRGGGIVAMLLARRPKPVRDEKGRWRRVP